MCVCVKTQRGLSNCPNIKMVAAQSSYCESCGAGQGWNTQNYHISMVTFYGQPYARFCHRDMAICGTIFQMLPYIYSNTGACHQLRYLLSFVC